MKNTAAKFKVQLRDWSLFAVLLLLGILMLYPHFYAILSSFSSQAEIDSSLFLPRPTSFTEGLGHYTILFKSLSVVRSILLTLGKIAFQFVIVTFLSVLCGYVFAKLEFKGKNFFFLLLLTSLMMPGVALLVPNYIWMARFPLLGGNDILGRGGHGLINNPAFLFVTGWVNVYNIFLCRQSFASIGNELAESAEIDGAPFLRVVFTIYMPLIRPILAVMFLNLFVGVWNDYMSNLIYLPDIGNWHTVGNAFITVMDIFSDIQRPGGPILPITFATAIVAIIPPLFVFTLVQKSFIEGLTVGAVKG